MYHEKFTLITGASRGLGRQIALECAHRGHNLILVALPGLELSRQAQEIEARYGVEAIAIETDLTESGAVNALVQQVLSKYAVSCLVNNAGIGGTAPIAQAEVEHLDSMLLLNIRSMVLLTRLLLPELLRHERAYILNVSSAAAFSPMAYKAVYAASKAFVNNFSQALREELRGGAVSVSVVSPGPMVTNFSVARRIVQQGFLSKLALVAVREVAYLAVKGMLANKPLIIPGLTNKIYYFLMKILPPYMRLRLISRGTRRELRHQEKPRVVAVPPASQLSYGSPAN
jgi:uncharacterized protein